MSENKNNDKKETNIIKNTAKSFGKAFTWGSPFDPDLHEENVNKSTKEFTDKEIINHLTGKEKLSKEDVEELKKQAKFRRFL